MPRMRACAYCGRIHSGDCQSKPKRLKESTDITKLRTCRRWNMTRHNIYERDHHMCRVCWDKGRITVDGLEAHHIVPLVEDPDMAYDDYNLITLCVKHHKAADADKISRAELMRLASRPVEA